MVPTPKNANQALLEWLTTVAMIAIPVILLVVVVSALTIYGTSSRKRNGGE